MDVFAVGELELGEEGVVDVGELALVRAVRVDERERCAKVADAALGKWDANCSRPMSEHSGPSYAAAVGGAGASKDIADQIRALGNEPQEGAGG